MSHDCLLLILNAPQFCHNNKKAQKYLLGGFECVVKLHQVQLLPRVPIILKDLYDADLLEEDVIFAWAEKVGLSITAKKIGSFWKIWIILFKLLQIHLNLNVIDYVKLFFFLFL